MALTAQFSSGEVIALWSVLGTAVAGLFYAAILMVQVLREDTGTPEMQKISKAIRVGANAYLNRQFRTILFLILLLTAALYFTAGEHHIAVGRAAAFLMGSIFSAIVGFAGMNLAVRGNVRVAAAANRKSFSDALKIAYRTGTITGMLTDGLGLFGGTLIFMIYGEKRMKYCLDSVSAERFLRSLCVSAEEFIPRQRMWERIWWEKSKKIFPRMILVMRRRLRTMSETMWAIVPEWPRIFLNPTK